MIESSRSAQFQILSKKVEPSPSMVTQMGSSQFTMMDLLGWGVHWEVLTDVLAWLRWKSSADSITWSQFSSSPIWWSTQQERASGFIKCHPGQWTRDKLNHASQRDQQACQ